MILDLLKWFRSAFYSALTDFKITLSRITASRITVLIFLFFTPSWNPTKYNIGKMLFIPFVYVWVWVLTGIYEWKKIIHESYCERCVRNIWSKFFRVCFTGTCPKPILRSSQRRCSLRKGVQRNFAKFTRKHLCQSLIKRDSGTGVFLWILQNF